MRFIFVLAALLVCALPVKSPAQLVADGQTNVLDGVATNLTGGIIIGTNGTFTLLVITDGATVTNSSGNAVIGNNASAQSNRVAVTDAGSIWNNSDNSFYVGLNGSASELDILNGGLVADATGIIGQTSVSSNNLVLVSGTGSMWSNTASLYVGNGGSRNTLIVTNDGTIFSGTGTSYIGESVSASSNAVLITGPGSSWNCGGYFYLGYISGGHDQCLINNGGAFITSSTFDIGVYTSSNLLVVADVGSLLQCQTFRIGYSSTGNQCVVSNGATLAVNLSSQPTTVEGTFTVATVTGSGSVWTNGGDLDFGQYSNVLSITGGGTLVDNNGYIENGSGKPNTVIVAGTNSLWKNIGDLHIADLGAQLLITNGGTVVNNTGYLGDASGNNNCYALVSGPGSLWTNRNDLYVGNSGATNQLVVTDSGRIAATDIYVSNNGRLVVANSGTLLAVRNIYNGSSGSLYVGYNGGSPNQMVVSNAAVVTIGGYMQIGNFQGGQNNNTVTINGGSMIVSNSVTIESPGSLVLNSGLFRGSFSIYNYKMQTNAIVLNGGILQAGGIAYGSFSYPQPLVVGDGTDTATFQMLNSGTYSGGFVVFSNALLTGSGTVNGNITIGNGGTFAPGTTNIGTIVINGSLVLNNGSTTFIKLNALSGAADGFSGVTNMIYGGTLQLTNLSGALTAGNSFKFFSANNYSGAFNTLMPSTPGPGLRWDTNKLNIDGVLRVLPAVSSPPVFGNVAISGGNFVLNASSGIAYDPVWFLTSTNLASPIASWACWSTNYFDTNGAVNITNIIVPGEPERYFLLQVQ
jgi:T5SS/PEP-CTERM-associated repeat protein